MRSEGVIAGRLCALLAMIPLLASCGYHLAGTGNYLPEYINKMGVPTFVNSTPRYELDQKLTTAVINELATRTRYEIVPSDSGVDALLSVTINLYQDSPVSFNRESTTRKYEIRIGASIQLKDVAKNEMIYSNPSFVSPPYQYEIPQGSSDFLKEQNEALALAIQDFSRRLVSTMLEGF